jgi:enoyl-[acyl-carrier protein] reductase I
MKLAGKKAVIFGIINKRSLAYSIAKQFTTQGGEVVLVCQNERIKSKVEKLAQELAAPLYICDVSNQQEIVSLAEQIEAVDILIHSIAYAPTTALSSRISELENEDFMQTLNISTFSLIEIVKIFKDRLSANSSIITLSYLGATRVMRGYGVMGVAKAALEATVRYLAHDLGPDGVRVNAISAGPVKTMASATFDNFNQVLELVEKRSPMRKNITGHDVAELASFLASDESRLITGGVHFVDGGANILGA